MKLQSKHVDALRIFCEDNEINFRDNYSGRGMYGRSCIGIVGSAKDLMILCVALFQREGDVSDAVAEVGLDPWLDIHWDSMGMDMIYYWPDISV